MLCETCRRTHLLDVHRESKVQLDTLELRLRLINDKRLELDKIAGDYDQMRQQIGDYVERLMTEIEQQRDHALQTLDEQQHANDEAFWTGTGFDNGEKLDFFVSLVDTGKKRLAAKNITDKDLMELSDNLQTIPDVDEKMIESIHYTPLSLTLNETLLSKQYVRVHEHTDDDTSAMSTSSCEKSTPDHQPADCTHS